jgi:DNA-binding XRE family transcriptional regulator
MPMLATTSTHQLDNGDAETAPDREVARRAASGAESPSAGFTAPAAVSSTPLTPPAGTGSASPDAGSLERMARLRHLVRREGMAPEAAAREVGVDPIIAQLWLRLPDDLWPTAPPAETPSLLPGEAGTRPARPPVLPPAPVDTLRRVLTCRIPAPAFDRLRQAETGLLDAAASALEAGLAQARPAVAPGGWRFARRPLAVPMPAAAYRAVLQLAEEAFAGDPRDAAGWLIARGVGFALPLPTAEELAGPPKITTAPPAPVAPTTHVRFVMPPRRRQEARAPLPADDSAPSGEELRRRREASGLSQRDLAAAAGLSRGLVAEIERGRRRHVLTRLKLAETLAAVEQRQAVS